MGPGSPHRTAALLQEGKLCAAQGGCGPGLSAAAAVLVSLELGHESGRAEIIDAPQGVEHCTRTLALREHPESRSSFQAASVKSALTAPLLLDLTIS